MNILYCFVLQNMYNEVVMKKKETTTLIARIDPQLRAELEELAERDCRTLSSLVRQVLQRFVESQQPKRRAA